MVGDRRLSDVTDERNDVSTTGDKGVTAELQRNVDEEHGPRALGALYATETAAIFEHDTFSEVGKEICRRRGATYDGSLIERFHDMQTWWNALLDPLPTTNPAEVAR